MEEKKEDPLYFYVQNKRETIPDFNLEARDPEKIYNLYSSINNYIDPLNYLIVIPKDELDHIITKDYYAAAKKGEMTERFKKQCSRFTLQELEDIQTNTKVFTSGSNLTVKLKYLVYLNWLLRFLNMRSIHKTIDQLCDEFKIHQSSVKSILERFFVPGPKEDEDKTVYLRNDQLTDKLICYILVLALIYGDYEFDATVLIATMKADPKK